MNYKKKSLILGFFLVAIIQIILFVNNSQKSSFRYFIWNIDNVSVGKLISISFMSGLLISSILNKTISNNNNSIKSKEVKNNDNDFPTNSEDNYDSFEMPPQRDIRETQPTISVKYRVIKNRAENESKEINEKLKNNYRDQDDWDTKDTEW